MELQFLHHGSVNLTVDNELYYIDVGSVNHLAELSHWANERSGYGQTVLVLLLAVHVTWDKTLFAQLLCGFLAKVVAHATFYFNFLHNFLNVLL